MTDAIRASAERQLGIMRRNFSGRSEFRQASEAEFPHINFVPYRLTGRLLEAEGFRHLVDLENLRTLEPDRQFKRTLSRWWVSGDGSAVAGHFQTRPFLGRKLRDLLTGLKNLRWVAASRWFARSVLPREHVGFTTELDDGRFVTTSNAFLAGTLSGSPSVDHDFLPNGTPPHWLWWSQRERVAALLAASPGVHVRPFQSVQDLIASMHRFEAAREAYRESVGWVTLQELRRMSSRRWLAEAIYEQVQVILRKERASSTRETNGAG